VESGALYDIGVSVKWKEKEMPSLLSLFIFIDLQDFRPGKNITIILFDLCNRVQGHLLVIPLSSLSLVAEIQCNFCNTTHSSVNDFEVAENPSCPQINRTSSQPLSWVSL